MSISNREKIEKKIISFINKNSNTYAIVLQHAEYILISKRKKLTVYTINENNIFQPYEQNVEKMFTVLYGLKYTNNNTKELKDLIKTGFQPIVINYKDNIENILCLL